MAATNVQPDAAPNQRQVVSAGKSSRWFPELALVIVWLVLVLSLLAILQTPAAIAQSGDATETAKPVISRGSIYYLGSFSSAKDLVPSSGICGAFGLVGRPPVQLPEGVGLKGYRSRCETVVDAVVGSRDFAPENELSSPYKIAGDSRGRVMVADRGTFPAIHIFDFKDRKHSRITGGDGTYLQYPSALAIDGRDQMYVTDAYLGAILVYDPNGRLRRYIGNRKGERLFERPSGIAVDPASGNIYVADPPRNTVVILSAQGKVLAKLGTSIGGSGPGEFLAPTDVVVRNHELLVLDSQNYRIQAFDLAGNFHASIHPESMQPSQSLFIDSRGRIYLDGPLDTVQVFQNDGRLVFQFGDTGTRYGQFKEPAGIWIDRQDRIYVADTGNHRVQSFEWGIDHGPRLPHP
jgi:DNA-binding beta-propeller fold protein YncE